MIRASHALGVRHVCTLVLASHAASTAATVRTVAALAVVASAARRVHACDPARNPSCSGSPSRVRSIRCESLIALVSEYCPVRTASQIRASAPAGTLRLVTNWASHSRRTVSADRHALLLAMTSRR